MHSTINLDDSYYGSGKRIGYSILKYGLENHTKEIIEYCNSRDELTKREKDIITPELLKDKLCLNLREGGEGGWGHINSNEAFRKAKNKKAGQITGAMNGKKTLANLTFEQRSARTKKGIQTKRNLGIFDLSMKIWQQASQSTEAREKRKATLKNINHQQGEKNSMHGKMWIYSLILKQCYTIDKNASIPPTFIKGRKMKFDK